MRSESATKVYTIRIALVVVLALVLHGCKAEHQASSKLQNINSLRRELHKASTDSAEKLGKTLISKPEYYRSLFLSRTEEIYSLPSDGKDETLIDEMIDILAMEALLFNDTSPSSFSVVLQYPDKYSGLTAFVLSFAQKNNGEFPKFYKEVGEMCLNSEPGSNLEQLCRERGF
ncbi:hypothetical protein CCB80_09155 [Armatimonadetes bacterium Uphvl-Ar1]|nr:hypothetical protein CCB80_09155 [Armatimonadetes bacterium Uphvl-Ar1]